jgi:hypothetical protein
LKVRQPIKLKYPDVIFPTFKSDPEAQVLVYKNHRNNEVVTETELFQGLAKIATSFNGLSTEP